MRSTLAHEKMAGYTKFVTLPQLLSQIFPQAIFGSGHAANRVRFSLSIADSAESGRPIDCSDATKTSASVEMTILKAANPGPILPDRLALRLAMGLPTVDRIASVYASYWTQDEQSIGAAIEILRAGKADVAILSHSGRPPFGPMPSVPADIAVISSNDLTSVQIAPNRKYLILNETRGKMPFVNRVANFAVVLGSANLFEAINAGTPILFMNQAQDDYNQRAWDTLTDRARATGGARGMGSLGYFRSELERLPGAPRRRPYEIENASGETPIDQLLVNVAGVMDRQIK